MIAAFPRLKNRKRRRLPKIADTTLRDFSGGLRVTDNEIALTSKYATKLVNIFAEEDNSQALRFGTKAFAQTSAALLDLIYFQQHIVVVLVNGEIQKVTDAGIVTTIWNTAIAAALPGAPSGWSTGLTQVDFTEFRGELVITNGADKPLLVDNALSITYLQDLATGSNVYTPISKFCTTVANYTIMAGITGADTTVYISSTGTSGTWPGDPAPNDSTSFNVGAYTGKSSTKIHSIKSFKNFLVVFFNSFSVTFLLGNYDSAGNHVPEVVDTYDSLGTVNHKTTLTQQTDLIFAANNGVVSAEKHIYGSTLVTEGLSENLGDEYLSAIGGVDINNLSTHLAHDPLSKTLFLILHKADASIVSFGMRYKGSFQKQSWASVSGWSFTCNCTSEKGRLFFGEGDRVYQYGNSVFTDEDYAADYIIASAEGNDIVFDWEFPWLDAGNRVKSKKLKDITFDTTGTSAFSLQCFVNNFYQDVDNNLTPTVEMDFVAGGTSGYGVDSGGYGGGRRANDERFFGFPIKFRILKMRIYGATKKPLRVSSLSLIYQKGTYSL